MSSSMRELGIGRTGLDGCWILGRSYRAKGPVVKGVRRWCKCFEEGGLTVRRGRRWSVLLVLCSGVFGGVRGRQMGELRSGNGLVGP